ncbi:MAG: glycosyltransferase family 39 protein [Isosphaeraceae bacterium]
MTGGSPGSSRLLDRFPAGRAGIFLVLAGILAVAAGLRSYRLGQFSFWYDETVTMRLAQAANPAELMDRLARIDATRAPLHPMILEGWIRVFGQSETSARALSVLCGVATVALVFAIGRAGFEVSTGLWAAWLVALSPALIVYSREARMYAWLVLAASACWWMLLGLRDRFSWRWATVYVLGLVVLGYSHPLGLIMVATLALAGLSGLRSCFGTLGRWLAVHLAAGALVAPWVVHYLDHPPEFLSGIQPIKVLLGTPIGFIGGDSRVLGLLVLLIGWGLLGSRARRTARDDPPIAPARADDGRRWLTPGFLLLWLIVPPLTLFVYSRLGRPIFGPQRYTVFVAPAYLLLVARGLVQTPAGLRYPLAAGLSILALMELGPKVYSPDLKADWRGFSADMAARVPSGDGLVIVAPSGEGPNVEVETARYYLPSGCRAIGLEQATPERLEDSGVAEVYLAIGLRGGKPVTPPPDRLGPFVFLPAVEYPGLTVLRAEHRPPGARAGRVGWSRFVGRGRTGAGAGIGLIHTGIGLEDRQHDGLQVALERGAGQAEGFLRGRADLEAPLLELGGDRAQAECLDDADGLLDLRVLAQIVPLAGAEVGRADRRGPHAVGLPSAVGAADPERGLDRRAVQLGREHQCHDDGAAAAPRGDRFELLVDRVRAIRVCRGGAVGIQQTLQLGHRHRGIDPGAGEGDASLALGHHHALVAEEPEPLVHGNLGRRSAAEPDRVGLGRQRQQALQRDRPIGLDRVRSESPGLQRAGQLGGREALGIGDPGLPGQHQATPRAGRPAVNLADLGAGNPNRDERGMGGPRRVRQPRELPVDPAEDPVVRPDALRLLPLLLPGIQPRPALLDRAVHGWVTQAIPVLQVVLRVLLGPAAADDDLDHAVRRVRRDDRPADHRAVAHCEPVRRWLVSTARGRRSGREEHAEDQQKSGHGRVRLIAGVGGIGISGRSSRSPSISFIPS